jgi:hypothetical protein
MFFLSFHFDVMYQLHSSSQQSYSGMGSTNVLLNIPPQQLQSAHTLSLPPGSPGAPLFLMNESSNHSQLSLSQGVADGDEASISYPSCQEFIGDNNSNRHNNSLQPPQQSQSTASGKTDLSRKLSFLSSSQSAEIEEIGGNSRTAESFKFMSGL